MGIPIKFIEVSIIIQLLIAEDEPIMRGFLKALMDWEAYGYKLVSVACDGQEALEIIQKQHIDVVMTDIKMPIISGIKLMQTTKNIAPHIKFLVLSGFDDFDYVSQAYKLGAVDYFLKAELSIEKIREVFLKLADEFSFEHSDDSVVNGHLITDLQMHKEKVGNLEQILYKNRWVLRGTILTDLFWGGNTHDESEILSAGLRIKQDHLKVMLIKVYQFNDLLERNWEGSIELLRFAFVNVIQEILDDYDWGDVFCNLPGEFVIVFSNVKDANEGVEKALINKIFHSIGIAIRQCFDITIGGGLSKPTMRYTELKQLYKQATQAFQFCFLKGKNKLIHYIDIENSLNSLNVSSEEAGPLMIAQKVNTFKDRLKNMNSQNVLQYIPKFTIDTFDKNYTQINQMRQLFDQYYFELLDFCTQYGIFEEMKDELMQYDNELRDSGDLDDLNQWLKRIFLNITKYVDQTNHIINQTKIFIHTHFNEDISLTKIASLLGVNSSHLSRTFHQTVGMNFIKFITKVRIERAMYLLLNSNYKIFEIAEMVGYTNIEHFSRSFKKVVGMSPSQYQNGGNGGVVNEDSQ